VSFYSDIHLRRLTLILRLQQRGYSLAAMRDLFEAWAAGQDLASVLTDPDGMLVEEAPAVLDHQELGTAVARLSDNRFDELVRLGVVIPQGDNQYCVPSPSILVLLDDALANGVSPEDALEVVGSIARGVQTIAKQVATVLESALHDRDGDEATAQLLRRGRVLVAQATSRLLLHELGLALSEPRGHDANSKMADLVDRVRIGRDGTPPERKTNPGATEYGE
jgi:alkylhydroperoxidase/carboxymuconolactone decarboxylase family protein YurZ